MIFKKYKKIAFYSFTLFMVSVITVNLHIKSITEKNIYKSERDIPTTQVGIIFGAGINGNNPSKYLKDRLDAGIRLYNSKKIQKILLSGDNGREEYDELTVMKNYCYQHGVDTTKIYIDYAGFDSYSTLYRAKKIFSINNAVLISQQYHLNRAIYIAKEMGINSIAILLTKVSTKAINMYVSENTFQDSKHL